MRNLSVRKFVRFFGVVLMSMLVSTAGYAEEGGKLKIGFVDVGPIGDAGWTYQHDLGRQAIEKKFGGRVEIKYIESVPDGAESERVVRELAASGHTLIFGTSFGFMNSMLKVARRFPNTTFEHATGYKTTRNVAYNARFYEGRYLAGNADGSLHPFAGPVIGQDDAVITAEGETMDDGTPSGMNFYVKGVVGSLPKYLSKNFHLFKLQPSPPED